MSKHWSFLSLREPWFLYHFVSQDEVNEWKTFYKYRYVVKLLEPVPKEYVYNCSLFVLLNIVYDKKTTSSCRQRLSPQLRTTIRADYGISSARLCEQRLGFSMSKLEPFVSVVTTSLENQFSDLSVINKRCLCLDHGFLSFSVLSFVYLVCFDRNA